MREARARVQADAKHRVPQTLDGYIRQRCRALELTATELCARAGISRQTLHGLGRAPQRLPALTTVVAVAAVLKVHPLSLLQFMFGDPAQLPTSAATPPADGCALVRDVTVPDGELVMAGQQFVKTWELQNVGHTTWVDRYLACMDEEITVLSRRGAETTIAAPLRPHAPRIAIPPTEPGETVQLSMHFTAPRLPGTVMSYWKACFADGTLCFPQAVGVWVKIQVASVYISPGTGLPG